ncbi:MAG TPA: UvrD-helicase domain-containing protein, partial [bacterium]|nr:UvrD-helicase domain-containing protein [bacterium]
MTNLNSAQLAAVSHTKGPLLVLAGPGSGKTMVLVQRLARIIEEGHAYPSEILSVTFTNKA